MLKKLPTSRSCAAWLVIVFSLLASLRLGKASNHTITDPPAPEAEGQAYLDLLFGVLEGVVAACLIAVPLVLRSHLLSHIKRRQQLQITPFLWFVVHDLKLSPNWIHQFNDGDGAILKQFISALPIEGRIVAPADEQPLVGDGYRPLSRLIMRRDWHTTRDARQLASLIAHCMRESEHLYFQKDHMWGFHLACDGLRFDATLLQRPHRRMIVREMVDAVREHLPNFKTTALDDRLRAYYLRRDFWGAIDPFKLPDQHIGSYYQPLELGRRSLPRRGVEAHARFNWRTIRLEDLINEHHTKVILRGQVGVGKTTWCQHLVQRWAVGKRAEAFHLKPAPHWLSRYRYVLFVPLRKWLSEVTVIEGETPSEKNKRVNSWLTQEIWSYGVDVCRESDDYPDWREVLFVLDGYDEVAHADRGGVFRLALKALLTPGHPHAAPHVIITTRPQVALDEHFGAFAEQARICRIDGLSQQSQKAFIENYFGDRRVPEHVDPEHPLLRDTFPNILERHDVLRQLQYNPLLLKMLCWLYFDEAHRSRSDSRPSLFDQDHLRLTPVYQEVVISIHRRVKRPLPDGCQALLKALANQSDAVMSSKRVSQVFDELGIRSEARRRDMLYAVSTHLGLLRPLRHNTDQLRCHWEFIHKSFQAYYRAQALCDQLATATEEAMLPIISEALETLDQDSLLVTFMFGVLSSAAHNNAIQILMNRAIDLCSDPASHRKEKRSLFWRSLREMSPEQYHAIQPPTVDRVSLVGGFIGAVEFASSLDLCDWLLSQMTDPAERRRWLRQTDARGYHAMHLAVEKGHKSLCQWLMDKTPHDAEKRYWLQQPNSMGQSPMHLAVEKGNLPLCQWLLSQVASEAGRFALLQKTDFFRQNVLHLAAKSCHKPLCQWLLSQITNEGDKQDWLLKRDQSDQTILHLAAEKGDLSFLDWLLRQIPGEAKQQAWLQLQGRSGQTILHLAAEKGDLSFLDWLLRQMTDEAKKRAWLQQPDLRGKNAMHLLVENGHTSLCRWLLNQMPRVEDRQTWLLQQDRLGQSVLHLAAEAGSLSLCEWLLEQIADMKIKKTWLLQQDAQGYTALLRAVDRGRRSVCELLMNQLSNDEDKLTLLKKVNRHGRSALFWAAWLGHQSIYLFLLKQVAAEHRATLVYQRDSSGQNMLGALRAGDTESVRALLPQSQRRPRPPVSTAPPDPRPSLLGRSARQGHGPLRASGDIVGVEEAKGVSPR